MLVVAQQQERQQQQWQSSSYRYAPRAFNDHRTMVDGTPPPRPAAHIVLGAYYARLHNLFFSLSADEYIVELKKAQAASS